jgi:hypothetical protein
MKVWILVLIALVLFLCMLREPFNPATERPSATDESLKNAVISIVGAQANTTKYIEVLQKFYDDKYLPDKRTPTPSTISSFLATLSEERDVDKGRLPMLIDYVFLSVEALDEVDYTCPEGFQPKDGTCKNDADQVAVPICPLTYDFQQTTKKCRRQGARGGGGTTAGGAENTGGEAASGEEGSSLDGGTSTTTGGTSTTTGGTRGGQFSVPGRNVWGPVFSGLGEGDGWDRTDSTSSNQYPELLGGGIPGGGAGGGGIGAGLMPGSKSLGTDANARFLPFSRQPGDMDVIPDPWRVSSTFTSSSYSSKTDPVPFLNDFSAFLK